MTWIPEEAEIFMVKNGWKPIDPYPGTNFPWKSIHVPCGLEGAPRMCHIQAGRVACKTCGRKRTADARRHTDESTISIMQNAGWEPIVPYTGNKIPWNSRCKSCGREGWPTFNNVMTHGSSCGFCSGNKVDPDVAWAVMRAASLEPQAEYPGAGVPWKSICIKCQSYTFPRFADVQYGVRCSTCSESGMNFSQPSHLYVMQNQSLQSIKVGISNNDSNRNRIGNHQKNGWELLSKYEFQTGKEASDLENMVLKWLRKTKNLKAHLSPEFMPQGGYSETFDATEISQNEIDRFIQAKLNSKPLP
jgi:hypothetical protein